MRQEKLPFGSSGDSGKARCLQTVVACEHCGFRQMIIDMDVIQAADDCGFCCRCVAHISLDTGKLVAVAEDL